MTDWQATRPGETEAPLPERTDARLVFIGRLRTPFASRDDCPRRGSHDGPLCRVEVDAPWDAALEGIEAHPYLDLLYWMNLARRDLVIQTPKRGSERFGTFALRSPVRPNPIAVSAVRLEGREGHVLLVRGLDCVDGTPLIDIKPNHCLRDLDAEGSDRPHRPRP